MAVSTINTLKEPDGAEKMQARMQTQNGPANPAMQDQRDWKGYQENEPEAESAAGGENDRQPQDEEKMMDKSMQQGLDMIRGLFGN